MVLALPREVWSPMPDAMRAAWLPMLALDSLPESVRVESEHIHRQLADLWTLSPGGSTRDLARAGPRASWVTMPRGG